MPPKAKGAGAKKKNGYQMPEKFDNGFVLKDIFKNNWTLGKPIGQGGFGLIYLANKGDAKLKDSDDAQYVVKIEPKDNGPLFCENHFYVNCAKEEELKIFIKAKNLKHLAMPKYISSGLCTYNEKEYRFLVMDRYTKDLQSFVNQTPSHQINEIGVMCLMRQILYALEYIHQKGYSHGDIKGANIMLKNDQESYLVDYGLAYRFKRDNEHQKYHIKPERKHNGTIEYTSRDAHDGAQISRRSDLEILGFCAIHWLSGTLPWIDLIKNAEQVQKSKIKSMENVKEFINNTFISANNVSENVKTFMEFYLNEVNKLKFESEPDYCKIHTKINDTLRQLGHTSTSLDNFRLFSVSKSTYQTKKAQQQASNLNEENLDEQESESEIKQTPKSKPRAKVTKPRSTKKVSKKESDNEKSNDESGRQYDDKFLINDLSGIENDTDEEFMIKGTANKKARNFLQSTAIDIDLLKNKKKQLNQDENMGSKSPRNLKATIDIIKTPTTRSHDQIKSSENVNLRGTISRSTTKKVIYTENDSEQEEQENGFNKLKEPDSSIPNKLHNQEDRTTIPKYNAAQLDLLNKFKQENHLIREAPRSPLALVNLEKDNGAILVKKRKNVPKIDACTQTDQSYLLTRRFKL